MILAALQVAHQRKGILRAHSQIRKFVQSRKASIVVAVFAVVVLSGIFFAGPGQAQAMTKNNAGYNPYPYPACTWWADQRYFQKHGYFVPWHSQANAWQWTARAHQFGWHVSTRPVLGSIIDLQPWVQGAYGLGHVAVVEKILRNGHVIASNMSWGANPYRVVDVEFAPGPGVTFIWH